MSGQGRGVKHEKANENDMLPPYGYRESGVIV